MKNRTECDHTDKPQNITVCYSVIKYHWNFVFFLIHFAKRCVEEKDRGKEVRVCVDKSFLTSRASPRGYVAHQNEYEYKLDVQFSSFDSSFLSLDRHKFIIINSLYFCLLNVTFFFSNQFLFIVLFLNSAKNVNG